MSDTLAVTIGATRADGSVEQVRIGTATRSGDGFQVTFFPMTIGGQVGAVSAAPVASAARSGARASGDAGGGDGMVFPPYGRSKGQPIRGASAQDLDFYANGCRRTLNDPGKARWHDKERALLAAIEAEQARQRGGGSDSGGDYGGGSSGGFGFGGEPPPPGDEDAPF